MTKKEFARRLGADVVEHLFEKYDVLATAGSLVLGAIGLFSKPLSGWLSVQWDSASPWWGLGAIVLLVNYKLIASAYRVADKSDQEAAGLRARLDSAKAKKRRIKLTGAQSAIINACDKSEDEHWMRMVGVNEAQVDGNELKDGHNFLTWQLWRNSLENLESQGVVNIVHSEPDYEIQFQLFAFEVAS